MSDDAQPRVIELTRADLDAAIDVLWRAFSADPMLNWMAEVSAAPIERGARELFRFSCEVRYQLGWPLFGAVEGARLCGVAGISAPEEPPWPASLRAVYAELKAVIGPAATGRLERYSAQADKFRPRGPHMHLGIIGVDPVAQGRGHGRALLDAVEALSDAHAESVGVWLDTENPRSRDFYARCGYRTIAPTAIEGIRIWCMFKPRGGWPAD